MPSTLLLPGLFERDLKKKLWEIPLDASDSRHLLLVKRLQKGEILYLLDGKGQRYRGTIIQIGRKSLSFELLGSEKLDYDIPITLAVGLTKPKNWEKVLEAAIEVGVREIIPLKTQFSFSQNHKPQRWERIIKGALQQSLNPLRPIIHEPQDLGGFTKQISANPTTHCILMDMEEGQAPETEITRGLSVKEKTDFHLIIGPEGGWDQQERQDLRKAMGCCGQVLSVKGPVMRVHTAIAFGVGMILQSMARN